MVSMISSPLIMSNLRSVGQHPSYRCRVSHWCLGSDWQRIRSGIRHSWQAWLLFNAQSTEYNRSRPAGTICGMDARAID